MKKVRWGVLGAAKIATTKVIPAMQLAEVCDVTAIASQSLEKARAAAEPLNIPKPYGDYAALLRDPDIDAVYIPLPNHLHVPWSIKALQANKHVLCEKPIALSAVEARELLETAERHPELKVMEAFMYRHHPQWQLARQLINEGKIGKLRTVHSFFSYYNVDPDNVRNQAGIGGGGLMDIGCYCISLARFLFGSEPRRVCGSIEYDPQFRTDRLATGILEFVGGTSTFTCGTQLAPFQRVNIYGTHGLVEIQIPFNAPPDRPCRIMHQHGNEMAEISLEICDQYTIQAELFSRAILDDTKVPTPLDDAVSNMKVITALFSSAEHAAWVEIT